MEKIIEDYMNSCYEGEMEEISPILKEVATTDGAILYEDQNHYIQDYCNESLLKKIFPNFEFNFNKGYFVEIKDIFYHGETFTIDVVEDYLRQSTTLT